MSSNFRSKIFNRNETLQCIEIIISYHCDLNTKSKFPNSLRMWLDDLSGNDLEKGTNAIEMTAGVQDPGMEMCVRSTTRWQKRRKNPKRWGDDQLPCQRVTMFKINICLLSPPRNTPFPSPCCAGVCGLQHKVKVQGILQKTSSVDTGHISSLICLVENKH